MYKLRLYITGHTPVSKKQIADLKAMLEKNCGNQYTLEVVDVFENPQQAYDDMVLATPMLIKTLPAPVRRIIGDLRDDQRVLAALEIHSSDA